MIKKLFTEVKSKLITTTFLCAVSAIGSIYLVAMVNQFVTMSDQGNFTAQWPVYLAAVMGFFLAGFVSQLLLAHLGVGLIHKVRSVLIQHVMDINFERLMKIGGHRIHATITTDVANLSNMFGSLPMFTINLGTLLLGFGYLAYQSFTLFGILFSTLVAGIIISAFIMRQGTRSFKSLREGEDEVFRIFKTLVDGAKELNINKYRRYHFFNKQALPALDKVREADAKAQWFFSLNQNWAKLIVFCGLGTLMFSAIGLAQVSREITISFILVTVYLIGPLTTTMTLLQVIFKGAVAYRKLKQLALTTSDFPRQVADDPFNKNWRYINFQGLAYRYESEDEFSVGPIDIRMDKGETIFITGSNGSGKSTFAKLVVGLLKPHEGNITIDSTRVTEENLSWYRLRFATIFSDFHLFEYALDHNGKACDQNQVKSLLEKLQLTDKVSVTDGKLSTTDLSQGQKKRLALLLAYLEDADIYLFDEWAADQDPEFRRYFYRELLPEMKKKGKTTIVISHDEQYFDCADILYVFEFGSSLKVKEKISTTSCSLSA